jgi:hypothetical protein
MYRREFLEEAGQLTGALHEIAIGIRQVFGGEDAMYLEADIVLMQKKMQYLSAIVERKIIEEKVLPKDEKPIPLKMPR